MLAYPEYPQGHCVFLHSRIFAFLPQNQRRRPPPLPQPGYGPELDRVRLRGGGNVTRDECVHMFPVTRCPAEARRGILGRGGGTIGPNCSTHGQNPTQPGRPYWIVLFRHCEESTLVSNSFLTN